MNNDNDMNQNNNSQKHTELNQWNSQIIINESKEFRNPNCKQKKVVFRIINILLSRRNVPKIVSIFDLNNVLHLTDYHSKVRNTSK